MISLGTDDCRNVVFKIFDSHLDGTRRGWYLKDYQIVKHVNTQKNVSVSARRLMSTALLAVGNSAVYLDGRWWMLDWR